MTLKPKPIDPDLIAKVQRSLMEDADETSWEAFVDRQEMGQCQSIVHHIIQEYPQFTACVGEIETDEGYRDEDGRWQHRLLHHWVELEGQTLDFAKGTLRNYVYFTEPYDPHVEDAAIYHLGYRKTPAK